MSSSGIAAIIPAAGAGTRLVEPGVDATPKAVRLLGGQTLVRRSASTLASLVDLLVLATPVDRVEEVRRDLDGLGCPLVVLPGGATRQESVQRALSGIPPETALVLVHDAARPLVPAAAVQRVIAALRDGAEAVVPVIPVADSLRRLDGSGGSAPVDRSRVRAVQTPQGFQYAVLVDAHASARSLDATDDAGLAEQRGHRVTLVPGDPLAFKITTPLDLLLAEAVLRASS